MVIFKPSFILQPLPTPPPSLADASLHRFIPLLKHLWPLPAGADLLRCALTSDGELCNVYSLGEKKRVRDMTAVEGPYDRGLRYLQHVALPTTSHCLALKPKRFLPTVRVRRESAAHRFILLYYSSRAFTYLKTPTFGCGSARRGLPTPSICPESGQRVLSAHSSVRLFCAGM